MFFISNKVSVRLQKIKGLFLSLPARIALSFFRLINDRIRRTIAYCACETMKSLLDERKNQLLIREKTRFFGKVLPFRIKPETICTHFHTHLVCTRVKAIFLSKEFPYIHKREEAI